jgi:hypothetical protein
MSSTETLWHHEEQEQQRTALDRLPVADISKRPESIASVLRQSQKANEVAGRIVGPERAEQIQKDKPHTKHPETLSKDQEVAYYQWTLYENLGIDKNTNANNIIKKFSKWIIDGLLVWNAEIIMLIKNEGIEKFMNTLWKQISTIEWIWQILKAVWLSLWDLATGDAYERGKSLAELGLITTGAGAAGSLAKYAGKHTIQASVKIWWETTGKNAISQSLHVAGRTAEVIGTGLQLPAKWVKKVAEWTTKVIGTVSEATGVSATLRAGARVWGEIYERSGTKKVVEGTRQAIKSSLDTGIATLGATEAVQIVKGKVSEVLETTPTTKEEALKTGEKKIIEAISPEEIARQIAWLEKLWFPEALARDLLNSWLLNQKFKWGDLSKRFQDLADKWADYHKMIDEAIKIAPTLTKEEALLIFSYTDETLYRRLNSFMRWDEKVIQSLNPENISVVQELIQKLQAALEKMPNLKPWEDGFVFRWDKEKYWQWGVWTEIDLKDFKSVSNNTNDIFLWDKFKNDTRISLIWLEWKVKDISSLAIATQFWGNPLKRLDRTLSEWVLLPNARVRIIGRVKVNGLHYIDIRQIK